MRHEPSKNRYFLTNYNHSEQVEYDLIKAMLSNDGIEIWFEEKATDCNGGIVSTCKSCWCVQPDMFGNFMKYHRFFNKHTKIPTKWIKTTDDLGDCYYSNIGNDWYHFDNFGKMNQNQFTNKPYTSEHVLDIILKGGVVVKYPTFETKEIEKWPKLFYNTVGNWYGIYKNEKEGVCFTKKNISKAASLKAYGPYMVEINDRDLLLNKILK